MKTQEQMILEHLQRNGKITSWEAITSYRITRLSSVIYNLRAQGYDITTENQNNKDTGKHWAVYTLKSKEKQITFC